MEKVVCPGGIQIVVGVTGLKP